MLCIYIYIFTLLLSEKIYINKLLYYLMKIELNLFRKSQMVSDITVMVKRLHVYPILQNKIFLSREAMVKR